MTIAWIPEMRVTIAMMADLGRSREEIAQRVGVSTHALVLYCAREGVVLKRVKRRWYYIDDTVWKRARTKEAH